MCLACSLPQFSDSFFDLSNSTFNISDSDSGSYTDERTTEDIIRNLSPYANKYCVIGSFNINSLSGKFSEVQEWIQVFDILTIQETKIDGSFLNSQFAIEGYNMYRRDRKKGGGGIVLYIRKTIPSYRLRIKCNEVEAIVVDIQIGQQHISLICGYKPPSVKNNTFSDEMHSLLDAAISNSLNLICLGHLNCDILHPLEDEKEGRVWMDICDIYDLQNLICEPTRISKTRESCLDLIATNAPVFALHSGTLETGLSDHKLVYTVLNRKAMKPKTVLVKRRCFKNFDTEVFNKDLDNVPFEAAYIFDDTSDVCWAWETMYKSVLDNHAPMKSQKRKPASGQSKFITPELRRAIRKINSLKRKFNKSRSADN